MEGAGVGGFMCGERGLVWSLGWDSFVWGKNGGGVGRWTEAGALHIILVCMWKAKFDSYNGFFENFRRWDGYIQWSYHTSHNSIQNPPLQRFQLFLFLP